MKKAITLAFCVVLSITASAVAAVFVEDFDDTDIGVDWGVYDTFGQFVTTSGAGIEIERSGTVVPSHSGLNYVELDSHSYTPGTPHNSSMAALIDLVAGVTYELTFAYRPRTNNDNDNGIEVSIGSLVDRTFSVNQLLGSVDGTRDEQNAWQLFSMVFTAEQGDDALQFSAIGQSNSYGGFLDTISVAQVTTPLPAAGMLLITGIAVLSVTNRKKKLSLG